MKSYNPDIFGSQTDELINAGALMQGGGGGGLTTWISWYFYIRNKLCVDAHDVHYTKLQLYFFLNRKLLVYFPPLQRC